jgi:hypothetical protein
MDRDEALRLSIRDRVLRRASTDEDFRRLLLDNPKSAIARELGIDVPDGVHVTVLPEGPNHVFVVLPPLSTDPQFPIVTGVERLAGGMDIPYAAYASAAYYAGGMPTYGA